MDFDITPAAAADEQAVIALWHACGLVVSHNDPAADFSFARARENSDILVAVTPARSIVGSVMVGHDGHRGWLYYVAVAPHCRHQGIGRALVEAGEKYLSARRVPKLQLMVRETNAEVIRFYERLGFESIPRTVMQKWLNDNARVRR